MRMSKSPAITPGMTSDRVLATEPVVAFEDTLDAGDWADLAARVRPGLRFLAHGWWQAWADAMLPHGNWRGPLRFAVARDWDGRIQAVLPAAEQVMMGIAVLSLAGNYKPFRSWLIAEDAPATTTAALVRFLTEEARPKAFRLGPVQTDEAEIAGLRGALADAGWRFCRITGGTEYLLRLPDDFETYKAAVGSKKFQRIRYKKNRFAKTGAMRLERYRGVTPDVWQKASADVALIERASWLDRLGGDPNFADPGMAAFWLNYLGLEQASASTSIWVLYLDDRPLSFNMVIDSGDCRYLMALAYDEAFQSHSPGKIIFQDSVISAFDDGIRLFNMGQGDSGYKVEWGAGETSLLDDWIAFPPSAAGRLLHLAARAKFGASD